MRIRSMLPFVLLGLIAAAAKPATAEASHCSTLLTTLTGPAVGGVAPTGRGDWRGTPACTGVELKVEVWNVNLPDATVLTLETCGLQAPLTLRSRVARFELKQSAPTCTTGAPITVRRADATILSGVWCNPLFSRCN